MQRVCSVFCAMEDAASKRKAKDAAKTSQDKRETREKLKRRSDYAADAQKAVNAYVRARDKAQPCISCGTTEASSWHAGHYRSVGSCPELRYDVRQIHKQCAKCNTHLSGNLIRYRIGLIDRVSEGMVNWIEGPHNAKKYTIDDLKRIKKIFAAKLKRLK